jgi:hypothetical protein
MHAVVTKATIHDLDRGSSLSGRASRDDDSSALGSHVEYAQDRGRGGGQCSAERGGRPASFPRENCAP